MKDLLLSPSKRIADSANYKWWVFGAIAIGTFVSVVDQTSVNLALPRIANDFDATIPAVQWVALGYLLATCSLLLPMGRLSDIIGRRLVYALGFVVFCLGAALAGASPVLSAVILFKILQGVGAAMIQANGMAIVTSTFPGGERGKVIGLFMTVVGAGAIIGPVVGGAIVEWLDWRYVFFMGVPLGVVSVVAALVILRREPPTTSGQTVQRLSFDWMGAILSTTALATFLIAMTFVNRIGLLSVPAFALVAGLVVAFIWWERRTPQPMLALELFKSKLFSTGTSASIFSFLASSSSFFLMPFYLQEVLEYSPGQSGLIIAPAALAFGIGGPVAGRLSDRYGWRKFAITGLVFTGVACLTLSTADESAPIGLIVAAMVMLGMGMGFFFSPNASAVLSTVEKSRYGIATAFLHMLRNTANVTGIGLATAIVTAVMASQGYEPSLEAVSSATGEGVRAAFAQGLRLSYLVLSAGVVVAMILTLMRGKGVAERRDMPGADTEVTSEVWQGEP